MKELVFVKKEQAFTTSLVIAEGTDNQHESIIRMIQKNLEQFERWGKIKFMSQKTTNPLGGRPTQVALLNEQQAMFLITLLKNTDVVIDFKFELIQMFFERNYSKEFFNKLNNVSRLNHKRYVYIAEMNNGTVKVGVSKSPEKRLKGVSSGSGLEIVNAICSVALDNKIASEIESALKKCFSEQKVRGEFFSITFETACDELKKYADVTLVDD